MPLGHQGDYGHGDLSVRMSLAKQSCLLVMIIYEVEFANGFHVLGCHNMCVFNTAEGHEFSTSCDIRSSDMIFSHAVTILPILSSIRVTSQERHSVSNHQQLDSLFKNVFSLPTKRIEKLSTGSSWGEPTGEFASQRTNDAERALISRHVMMTSSNGNIFRVTGPLCGEFTGPGEFPTQRPVTRSFDVFFDLRLNKRLSKQPWGWWSETPSSSSWRHRNVDDQWDIISRLSYIKRSIRCWVYKFILYFNDKHTLLQYTHLFWCERFPRKYPWWIVCFFSYIRDRCILCPPFICSCIHIYYIWL